MSVSEHTPLPEDIEDIDAEHIIEQEVEIEMPPCPADFSSKAVVDEAFNVCVADLQRGTDWRRRYVALQWLELLSEKCAFEITSETPESERVCHILIDRIDDIRDAVAQQLSDMRSQLVKRASMTVCSMAEQLQEHLVPVAASWLSQSIQLVSVSIGVMSSSGHQAALDLVTFVPHQHLLSHIVAGCRHKRPQVAARCLEYLTVILDKLPEHVVADSQESLTEDEAAELFAIRAAEADRALFSIHNDETSDVALKTEMRTALNQGLNAANPQVRAAARSCLAILAKVHEPMADSLIASMSNTARRLYHQQTNPSGAESEQTSGAVESPAPIVAKPSGMSVAQNTRVRATHNSDDVPPLVDEDDIPPMFDDDDDIVDEPRVPNELTSKAQLSAAWSVNLACQHKQKIGSNSIVKTDKSDEDDKDTKMAHNIGLMSRFLDVAIPELTPSAVKLLQHWDGLGLEVLAALITRLPGESPCLACLYPGQATSVIHDSTTKSASRAPRMLSLAAALKGRTLESIQAEESQVDTTNLDANQKLNADLSWADDAPANSSGKKGKKPQQQQSNSAKKVHRDPHKEKEKADAERLCVRRSYRALQMITSVSVEAQKLLGAASCDVPRPLFGTQREMNSLRTAIDSALKSHGEQMFFALLYSFHPDSNANLYHACAALKTVAGAQPEAACRVLSSPEGQALFRMSLNYLSEATVADFVYSFLMFTFGIPPAPPLQMIVNATAFSAYNVMLERARQYRMDVAQAFQQHGFWDALIGRLNDSTQSMAVAELISELYVAGVPGLMRIILGPRVSIATAASVAEGSTYEWSVSSLKGLLSASRLQQLATMACVSAPATYALVSILKALALPSIGIPVPGKPGSEAASMLQLQNPLLKWSIDCAEAVAPCFLSLCEALVKSDHSNMKKDDHALHPKVPLPGHIVTAGFSKHRMALVDVVCMLAQIDSRFVAAIPDSAWRLLVNWFFEYRHNNMYAIRFSQLIQKLLRLPTLHESVLKNLMTKHKLLTKMVQFYENTANASSVLHGVILELTNQIRLTTDAQRAAASGPSSGSSEHYFLPNFLQSHDLWKHYVVKLKTQLRRQLFSVVQPPLAALNSGRVFHERDTNADDTSSAQIVTTSAGAESGNFDEDGTLSVDSVEAFLSRKFNDLSTDDVVVKEEAVKIAVLVEDEAAKIARLDVQLELGTPYTKALGFDGRVPCDELLHTPLPFASATLGISTVAPILPASPAPMASPLPASAGGGASESEQKKKKKKKKRTSNVSATDSQAGDDDE